MKARHHTKKTQGHSSLIYTKVRIPRSADLLQRDRLLDFLRENIHRKLLLVCAGPGYGKTSLLVDFARHTNVPVCWYTLDPSDRDPRIFLDYLVESIQVRFPGFGKRARTLLRQGEILDLRGAIGLLVNELADLPGSVVIVLDEYQAVDVDDGVNQAVSLLLQYLPENIHLVIAGRSVPSISLISLMARGEVSGIGTSMLRFTFEEVQALLPRLGLHPSEEQAGRLTEESEGWITAILLGAQSAWQEFMSFLARTREPSERVYAYVTSEVLSHLAPEVRSFLHQAAILNRMDVSLCDALLERNDSAQVLDLLEQRNLFLVALEGGWYRFHGLFRESLLRDAREEWDEFVRLNRRAAQLWRERGEMPEVVEHLLQARAYTEAAQEVEQIALECLVRGQLRTLLRWIEALPESVRQEHPRIILFLGRVYTRTGREEASAVLQQAEQLLAQRGDQEAWLQAAADRSTVRRQRGAYSEALQIAQEALPYAKQSQAAALVDLYRTIGICLYAQGDLPAAEKHLHCAVEHSLKMPSAYNRALALQDWGVCLRAQGRMQEAESAYRGSLGQWQTIGNPGPMASILNNLAMGPFLRGDFQEAQILLQQALQAAQDSLVPDNQALVQASLGDLYRDQGDLPAARKAYREGLDLARCGRNAALIAYLLEALGNLSRRRGVFSEAQRYLEEAMAGSGSSQHDRARVQVSQALLEVARGRPEEATGLLQEAVATLEQGGECLQLLRARLAQAITWQRLGKGKAALEALAQAVSLATEMGVAEPFLAEAGMLQPLLRKGPKYEGSFWQEVLRRLQDYTLSRKVLLVDEGQSVLRLLALGPGQVFREEREIPTRNWKGRARELVFYLFFHSPVRREQVCLAFWPDLDKDRLRHSFHSLLYRARQAIGVNFVTFYGEVYCWNPEIPCWCDAVAFEEAIGEAEGLPLNDPQAPVLLEKALSLYQGDFLEDFDSEWCTLRRGELQERYVQALLRLGEAYLQQKVLPLAQRAYERALQEDSFREEAYRGLMRCYAQAGERASAIQVYQRCRQYLGQELFAEPSEETQVLYRSILQGEQ